MEKIKKLQEVREKLKQDFIGIDEIIDKVIDSISPWYLTPEILERPLVVSLFGLTGTGKTSLIRKLLKYLELYQKSLFFDCGEQSGDKPFVETLGNLLETSVLQENDCRYSDEELSSLGINFSEDKENNLSDPIDFVFVLDEFQYLNTKNPLTGEENNRYESRAVWSILDSGIIDINRYDYSMKKLKDYLEDMEFLCESHKGLHIKSGYFSSDYNELLRSISYYRWCDDCPTNIEEDEEKSNPEKKNNGFRIIFPDDLSYLTKRLNLLKRGLGFQVTEKFNKFEILDDYVDYIRKYIKLISKQTILNCTKSLVFVLGNIDEAFNLGSEDLDPDIDADVYNEITSKVTIMDIKSALRKRFRDEQIGRLGNNIIIYPSLKSKDFETILKGEVNRILEKFKDKNNIEVELSEDFYKLIYSEGCYPIQGVRPMFSTINYLVSPLLSTILLSGVKSKILLDVKEGTFNRSQATLVIDSLGGEGRIGEKVVNLTLGALRSPDRCKKLGLQSIHEASHAVIYTILTGKYPSAIIASNIYGNGGYMMDEVDKDYSTISRWEFETEVIVSLAGYYGELEFFSKDMCSLGSSSDIEDTFSKLKNAVYCCGWFSPLRYSEKNVSCVENGGLPLGYPSEDDPEFNRLFLNLFDEYCEKTKKYIHEERRLIAEVSKYLLENRSMTSEIFKSYVEKYRNTNKDIPSTNYYKEIIENETRTNL